MILGILLAVFAAACAQNGQIRQCDYSKPEPKYVGRSIQQCSTIKFMCEQNMEYFENDCGCGCKLKEVNQTSKNEAQKSNFCTPEQKAADFCAEIYEPVCGWFDSAKIQCVRYPCADAYSNSCFACMDEKVLYWTVGECPK